MSKKKDKHKRDEQAKAASPGRATTDQPPTADAELDALRQERDELMARLQRVSADYLNYQKRIRRDSCEAAEYANAELIKSLLPVLDDMERVLAAAKVNHGQDDPLYTGMQLVHTKAIETLGKFGLLAIDATGQPFDPDKHAAMAQQPSDEHPPQTVLQDVVKGYQLKGRTIRPSGVVISTSQKAEPPEAEGPDADEQPPPSEPDTA